MLRQRFSESGPWTSSVRATWDLVRDASSCHSPTRWTRSSGVGLSDLWADKPSEWLPCRLKFESPFSKVTSYTISLPPTFQLGSVRGQLKLRHVPVWLLVLSACPTLPGATALQVTELCLWSPLWGAHLAMLNARWGTVGLRLLLSSCARQLADVPG